MIRFQRTLSKTGRRNSTLAAKLLAALRQQTGPSKNYAYSFWADGIMDRASLLVALAIGLAAFGVAWATVRHFTEGTCTSDAQT